MRAVIDPGVLVSALLSPGGPPGKIVLAWTEERFELVVSPSLLEELAEVLSRPKFEQQISAVAAADFVAGLASDAMAVADSAIGAGTTPDPDDDYLVALARSAGADFLVSGDAHLRGLEGADPPVLSPRQFLDELEAEGGV